MMPDETPGNPLGGSPPPAQGPPPAAPREPLAAKDKSQDNGTAPVGQPPTPEPAPHITETLILLTSRIEGLTTDCELIRKRQKGIERQVIMLFGVLAVISWRLGTAKFQGVIADATPTDILP